MTTNFISILSNSIFLHALGWVKEEIEINNIKYYIKYKKIKFFLPNRGLFGRYYILFLHILFIISHIFPLKIGDI